MLPENETPEPAKTDQTQTFGGEYHRLDSTFRPDAKTAPVPRGTAKRKPRAKSPRKPSA